MSGGNGDKDGHGETGSSSWSLAKMTDVGDHEDDAFQRAETTPLISRAPASPKEHVGCMLS